MTNFMVDARGSDSFMVGDWRIEPASNSISRQGATVSLEPKTMAVLEYLAAHADQVVSSDTLIAEIWDDRPMGDNPVYKCIGQLRKALGDNRNHARYIATVPKKGYRLIAAVDTPETESETLHTGDEQPLSPGETLPSGEPEARPVVGVRVRGLLAVGAVFSLIALLAVSIVSVHNRSVILPGDGEALGVSYLALNPGWNPATCDGTESVEACQRYKMAIEHFKGRTEGYKGHAIHLLEEALALDPGFAAAHAAMATAYIMPGDEIPWPEAKIQSDVTLQRALELRPGLPETRVAQAITLMAHWPCPPVCVNLGDYRAAEQPLREAIADRPEYPIAHVLLGTALFGQGRLDEAFNSYETAFKLDPLMPSTNYYIALGFALRGDYAGARRHVKEFIEGSTRVPPYLYGLAAKVEKFYGNLDSSLHFYRLRMQQLSYAAPIGRLAEVYYDLGMFEHAEQLLEENRSDAWFEASFVRVYRKLLVRQDRRQKLAEFSDALVERAGDEFGDRDEEWPRWLLQALGQNRSALGEHRQAVAYLAPVFGDDGSELDHHRLVDELEVMHTLAHSLMMVGETARAEAIVAQTLALLEARKDQGYGGLPDLVVAQARAHALGGRKALAVATLRQAIAQGWRGYWSIHGADDPCWDALLEEADFRAMLADVRTEVDRMRARAEIRLTHAETSTFHSSPEEI